MAQRNHLNYQVNCVFTWIQNHWIREFEVYQDYGIEARVTMRFKLKMKNERIQNPVTSPPLFGPLNYFQVDLNHILVTIITKRHVYLRPYSSLLISHIYMNGEYMVIEGMRLKLSETVFTFNDSRDYQR
jgi:hypothetical protein